MKARLIANPYIVYAIGFIIALIIYTLNWSDLYPSLSIGLVLFVIISALLSIIAGLLLHKTNYLSYNDIYFKPFILWIVTLLIIAGILFECAYLHVVPLIAVLTGQSGFRYTEFGIPTFHVFLVTFNSFWSTFLFHNYVSQKKKRLLICFIIACFVPPIIIFSRSMILLNLTSAFFILFMATKNLKGLIVKAALIGTGILFLFGIAGNLRESHGSDANDLIMQLGKATPEFKESSIPKEFFWSYLYISSPLANLQETIDKHKVSDLTLQKLGTYANQSFFPDFVSKRITYFTYPDEKIDQILFAFTVGTTYALCYAYLGWWGIIGMFLYIAFFNFLIIVLIPRKSIFFISGIAILNCIMLFSIFDNMIAFSGTSFQLFYVIFFGVLGRINFAIKNPDDSTALQQTANLTTG